MLAVMSELENNNLDYMPREIVIDGISLLRWGLGDLKNISCKPTCNENKIFHRSNITALIVEVDLEKIFA